MTFLDAVKTCFRKYVTFTGRASRSEFWWWILFIFAIQIVLGLIYTVTMFTMIASASTTTDAANPDNAYAEMATQMLLAIFNPVYWLMFAWGLAVLLPNLAVIVRRLHDTGRSGWWIFISVVPLVGSIMLLVFCAEVSQRGTNAWGEEVVSGAHVGPASAPVAVAAPAPAAAQPVAAKATAAAKPVAKSTPAKAMTATSATTTKPATTKTSATKTTPAKSTAAKTTAPKTTGGKSTTAAKTTAKPTTAKKPAAPKKDA